MSAQGVNFTINDNGLSAQAPGTGNVHVVIGTSSAGSANTVVSTASPAAIVAAFGYGPLPELATYIAQSTGNQVLCIKANVGTAGSITAVTAKVPGGSTSVVTVTGTPYDDYQGQVYVITGGTIGTAGIVVGLSVDGGRTFYSQVALGTATSVTTGSTWTTYTGITVSFAAGTLVAGDSFSWYATAPLPGDANVTSAIASLKATPIAFVDVFVTGNTGGSGTQTAANLDAQATALAATKRFTRILGHARDALNGGASTESELTWITSLTSDFAAVSSNRVGVTAGHYNFVSAISQSQMRRPLLWAAAQRDAKVAIQVDLGRVKDGSISNLILPSSPDGYVYHDESVNAGLDAARFITAWTIYGKPGLFIKNPNIMAPPGSDFGWLQRGHVIDVACELWYAFATNLLSDSLRVNATTGFILETDARDIETRGTAYLVAQLGGAVSSVTVTLSRTDNILSTSTLTAVISVVPLGYVKSINTTVTLVNPAIVAVGS